MDWLTEWSVLVVRSVLAVTRDLVVMTVVMTVVLLVRIAVLLATRVPPELPRLT